MRRSEHSGSQAIGAGDAGAKRRGAALAVGSGHNDRDAREPLPIHREGIEQVRHSSQTNAIAVFWKIKHKVAPWPKTCGARFSGSDPPGRIVPAAGSTDLSSPRSLVS